MQSFHAERMKGMINTQIMLVEYPEWQIKFIGPMKRKKMAMKEENGFGVKLS
jgi:hypothetical protein